MSALAKPLNHTITSDVAISPAVNAENTTSVSTADIPSIGDNGKTKYTINFAILGTDGQTKDVVWTFSKAATAQADRDAAYVAFIAANSIAV